MRTNTLLMALLVLVAALWRLIPHPFNFTPVAALALFSGARVRHPLWRLVLPLAVMALTDVILGFHQTEAFVYGAMILISLVGLGISGRKLPGYLTGALAGSAVFYLMTNFGVWLMSGMYPHSPAGLWACYLAGVPFLGYSLAGNLLFTGAFYGLFHSLADRRPDIGSDHAVAGR